MWLSLLALLLFTAAIAIDDDQVSSVFLQWAEKHGRKYGSDQEIGLRRGIWIDNAKRAFQLTRNETGIPMSRDFLLSLNHFADLTHAEWSEMMFVGKKFKANGTQLRTTILPSVVNLASCPNTGPISPPSFDAWRSRSLVGSIIDQGSCGSCYAIASCESIQAQFASLAGQHAQSSNRPSTQQILDCCNSDAYYGLGCQGGDPGWAMLCMRDYGTRLATEVEYPYTATDVLGCRNSVLNAAVTAARPHWVVADVFVIEWGNECQLREAISTIGPVVVAVDASSYEFMLYQGGLYRGACNIGEPTHAMLAVGWGTDPTTGVPYYIIKNSWGPDWGESGYMRWPANDNNYCDIASYVYIPSSCLGSRCIPAGQTAPLPRHDDVPPHHSGASQVLLTFFFVLTAAAINLSRVL